MPSTTAAVEKTGRSSECVQSLGAAAITPSYREGRNDDHNYFARCELCEYNIHISIMSSNLVERLILWTRQRCDLHIYSFLKVLIKHSHNMLLTRTHQLFLVIPDSSTHLTFWTWQESTYYKHIPIQLINVLQWQVVMPRIVMRLDNLLELLPPLMMVVVLMEWWMSLFH